MPAPPAASPAPPSPALHRTQFIRGVRDSMAKALAQGLGDTPADVSAAAGPPPPPPVQPAAARISITGRLKQLISSGERPALSASDQLLRTPPRAVKPAEPLLSRTPPRAVKPAEPLLSRTPPRVLSVSDQLLRSPVRVLSAVEQQLGRSPPPPPPPPPPSNSLKPIVRLPEGSAADPPGAEPAANGEASEERKRMIALAQLKILQRKAPSPQKLSGQEAGSVGGVGGHDSSPLKTYVRRAEPALAANGSADTPRKNVKLMPPLTLLVPPVKPATPAADLLKPDVEDASRCASGLLIRKTYYKVAPAPPPPPAVERNGAPPVVVVRRARGRPRRAATATATAGSPARVPPPPAAPAVSLPAGTVTVLVSSSPAVKPAPVNSAQPEEAGRGRRVAGGGAVPPPNGTGVKRRHASSSRGSDTSSGLSSGDASPKPKKSRLRTVRDLKSLFMDEGAINILSEMEAMKGEKRRTRVAADQKVYKPKTAGQPAASPGLRKAVTLSPGSLRPLPATRAGRVSGVKGNGRTVHKIKAKALKMKKLAEAKKAKKAATSAKLKALKVKVKQEGKSPKPTSKVTAKSCEKSIDTSAPKAVNQKLSVKVTAGAKVAKSNKSLSPSAAATKKPKTATANQLKPKKLVTGDKVEATNGKRSPPNVPVATPAKTTALQEKKKQQPKLTQDKNLNIIEKKTKEVKNGERKKNSAGEERQSHTVRDKSSSPSSKSSKSSSPLPLFVSTNPVPTSPSSLSYSSLQRRLEVATLKQVRRREVPGDRERASSRSNLGTVRHREICVKKFDRFHQVILCPVTTRLKAGINVQVMRELREYLSACERDPVCRAVLLTSSAGPFCQGLDYTCLLGLSPEKRRKAAEDLARELKEFVRAVAGFSKPLLAGVTGACVGLGVGLLPLCDLVYVSEKTTLQMPYSRLGTVPEGGATHSLTALLGHMKAGAMMMTGRAMTGTEAVSANLATGLLWSATAYEELIALARQVLDNAAQIQALESTKALIRHSLRAKLEQALHSECRLLVHQWSAPEFQQRVRQLYENGPLLLQKPGFDTQ